LKKLIAYITSALPDREFTIDLALAMKESGVDAIELGIPFSDPVADGPVIEEANLLALKNGFKIADTLYISQKIAKSVETLWMGYFNPFYHKGLEFFLEEAKKLGVSGFIIPDLPYEESLSYRALFDEKSISLIDFVAPTDDEKRIKTIVKDSKKFIYLVAYAGITGSDKKEDLSHIIENIKKYTDIPIYIGFGVDETTAKQKAKFCNGVIVGSAFVKILISNLTSKEKIDKICELSGKIKELINS